MSDTQGPFRVEQEELRGYGVSFHVVNSIGEPMSGWYGKETCDAIAARLNAAHAAGRAAERGTPELGRGESQEPDCFTRLRAAESALLASEARGRELGEAVIGYSVQLHLSDSENLLPWKPTEEEARRFGDGWSNQKRTVVALVPVSALSLPAAGALQRHDAGVRADTLTLAGAEVRAMDEVVTLDGQPFTPDGKTLRVVKAWLEKRSAAPSAGEGER